MDIWTGSVSLPPSAAPPFNSLEDIHLSTPPTSPPIGSSLVSHLKNHLSTSTLSFLSFVDPNRIPLFLAAGPSLSVTTSSPATENFLQTFFRSALPKSATDLTSVTPEQSQIALLLRVSPDPAKNVEDNNDWGITELCFYGSVTYPTPPTDDAIALTPPNSSPECENRVAASPAAIITVHALPLSSRHAFPRYLPQTELEAPTPPTSTPTRPPTGSNTTKKATFLAPNPHEILNPSISHSAKRRRADMLDVAIEKRKKPRRTVSALPPPPLSLLGKNAGNPRLPKSLPITPREESIEPVMRGKSIKVEPRSPSPSPGPLSTVFHQRRPALASLKRGATIAGPSVQRGMSVMSERPGSSQSMLARPKTPGLGTVKPKPEWGEIEQRNRESLNRVIVAVMKEHGLRDYRKERAKSVLMETEDKENGAMVARPTTGNKEDEKEREDYKMVFHHTVKAATFALRDVIEKETVSIERIKSVVERLVGVFVEGSVVPVKKEGGSSDAARRPLGEASGNSKRAVKDSLREQLQGVGGSGFGEGSGFRDGGGIFEDDDGDDGPGGVLLPDSKEAVVVE